MIRRSSSPNCFARRKTSAFYGDLLRVGRSRPAYRISMRSRLILSPNGGLRTGSSSHVPFFRAVSYTHLVFMNDMKGIMEAQTARGVQFDTGGVVKKARLMVPLCVPLLVSSVRKTNSRCV